VLIGNPTTSKLFRLFGDGDGDGAITTIDFALLRQRFGTSINLAFDFENDGTISAGDFAQFRRRFGLSVLP
jgi:dockerin type I repeat protein